MAENLDKQAIQKNIEIYQNVVSSVRRQIDRELEGLVLDSGKVRPEIVNMAVIYRLEQKIAEYEKKIADLQEELAFDLD